MQAVLVHRVPMNRRSHANRPDCHRARFSTASFLSDLHGFSRTFLFPYPFYTIHLTNTTSHTSRFPPIPPPIHPFTRRTQYTYPPLHHPLVEPPIRSAHLNFRPNHPSHLPLISPTSPPNHPTIHPSFLPPVELKLPTHCAYCPSRLPSYLTSHRIPRLPPVTFHLAPYQLTPPILPTRSVPPTPFMPPTTPIQSQPSQQPRFPPIPSVPPPIQPTSHSTSISTVQLIPPVSSIPLPANPTHPVSYPTHSSHLPTNTISPSLLSPTYPPSVPSSL